MAEQSSMFSLYVIQRLVNSQSFWMLALMPPPPCHTRGTLFYAEKFDTSTHEEGSVPQRTLKDQVLDDPCLISREHLMQIPHENLEGPTGFIECIKLAAGVEEKQFIKEALRNLAVVGILPRGSAQKWSRLNYPEAASSAGGSDSRSELPRSGDSIPDSCFSSLDSRLTGASGSQQRSGSSKSPPLKRVRSSTPGSGNEPPRSPRAGTPHPAARAEERLTFTQPRQGLPPAVAAPQYRGRTFLSTPRTKSRSPVPGKSRLSNVAQPEELVAAAATRTAGKGQSPNRAGPSSARSQSPTRAGPHPSSARARFDSPPNRGAGPGPSSSKQPRPQPPPSVIKDLSKQFSQTGRQLPRSQSGQSAGSGSGSGSGSDTKGKSSSAAKMPPYPW